MTNLSTQTLKFVYQIVLAVFLTLVCIHLMFAFGPVLERRLFPVMINGKIEKVEPVATNSSRLEFTAEKIRNCDWIRTSWWIGDPDGLSAQVPAVHKAPPQVRPTGRHYWNQLFVGLPEHVLRTASFSITFHRCHPFWASQSMFYDSRNDDDYSHVPENIQEYLP